VGRPTWEAISRNEVPVDLFDGVAEVRHVALGQQADIVIVAPATAHTLAQMAGGFAGDLLGTTLLASTAPVLIAPAMHTEMWEHPAVQDNVRVLLGRGVHMVGPEAGELTGGDVGLGRMAEPLDIAEKAFSLLGGGAGAWRGKTVVISAGGTREALDPVRFMGNRSTGEMGVALARAWHRQGATVTLVAAHLEVPVPGGVSLVHAETASAMREALLRLSNEADVLVMAAAVADWVPVHTEDEKISKDSQGEQWAPLLQRAPDILAELGGLKKPGQLLVGFAAETDSDPAMREQNARRKLENKKADVIVLNRVGEQVGFGPVETAVTLFFHASPQSLSVEGTKSSIAERITEVLLDR
jgi:phosphopantothenoylcysteine decarboxylase/phosphopantothenate--cysteine ligase